MPLQFSFLPKIKKKTITNIRKSTYNNYNNYIQYIQAINTSTMPSPFAYDKFRENTPYLSEYLGESKVLNLI